MSARDITLHGPKAALPDDLASAWLALRDKATSSPYFHPAYAEAVARHAPAPVRVLVSGRDTPRAILPVQGKRVARPAGAPMTDYHGVVGTAEQGLGTFLRQCGIGVLGVGGWTTGADTPPHGLDPVPACRIDLSEGVGSWEESRDGSYRRHAKSTRRRTRKATEEVGEPRLVWRSRDIDAFNTLVAWKRAQFATTRKFDVLGGWPGHLIRDLWERGPDSALRADLHALYFGDRLAALDLGLAEGGTFHSWIVAYDPELSAYAPGIQLLEGIVRAAPDLGYRTLDLGVGLDGYKRHYANVEARAGVGIFRTQGARAGLSRLYGRLETRADALARLRRRYTQISAVEPGIWGRTRAMGEAVMGEAVAGNARPPLPA